MIYDYDFRGLIEDPQAGSIELSVRISKPQKSKGDADDYYCEVQILPVLKAGKKIVGVDRKQAKQLAREFVRRLLSGKRITDANGNPVTL